MVTSCSSVMAIAHCFVLVLWHHCPCLFLVSAFPLCHWQGVEKLVHYFCDKAWYGTTSDFFPSPPHAFSLLIFLPYAWCMSIGDVHAVLSFLIASVPSFLKILQGENVFISSYRIIVQGIEMGIEVRDTEPPKQNWREF